MIAGEVAVEVATHMALLPLACLAWLHLRGERRDAAFWWIASAFAVSFVADTLARWYPPYLISTVYPLTQTAVIAAVFLTRREALLFVACLASIGVGAVFLNRAQTFDVLLRTVAWATLCGVVLDRWALGALRAALLVSFGGGLLAWYVYATWPNWPTWGAYHTVRLLGLLWFCVACWRPGPTLRAI